MFKTIIALSFFVFISVPVFAQQAAENTAAESSVKQEKKEPTVRRRRKEPPPQQLKLQTPPVTQEKPGELESVFENLEYPELQVVPRASDRLAYEAQNEVESWYTMHWPLQVSALSTLYLGMSASGKYKDGLSEGQRKDHDTAVMTATGIGAFWLGTTIFYTVNRPYVAGLNQIRKLKVTDKRGELLRERLAEEAMETPGMYMESLTKLSIASNIFAALYISNLADPATQKIAAVSGLLALTPWIFEHKYIQVWKKHQEYKRKIYSPLTWIQWKPDHKLSSIYPEVNFRWEF